MIRSALIDSKFRKDIHCIPCHVAATSRSQLRNLHTLFPESLEPQRDGSGGATQRSGDVTLILSILARLDDSRQEVTQRNRSLTSDATSHVNYLFGCCYFRSLTPLYRTTNGTCNFKVLGGVLVLPLTCSAYFHRFSSLLAAATIAARFRRTLSSFELLGMLLPFCRRYFSLRQTAAGVTPNSLATLV